MTNTHSTDGLAEDLIRSFVQIAVMEMHTKTLLEKCISEQENGLVDMDNKKVREMMLEKENDLRDELIELADIRRGDMLFLFEAYKSKGDKTQWCSVKHLGIAMMTAFEVWQASDSDLELEAMYLRKNKLFIKALSRFIGVEITNCASCFADILKGENK